MSSSSRTLLLASSLISATAGAGTALTIPPELFSLPDGSIGPPNLTASGLIASRGGIEYLVVGAGAVHRRYRARR